MYYAEAANQGSVLRVQVRPAFGATKAMNSFAIRTEMVSPAELSIQVRRASAGLARSRASLRVRAGAHQSLQIVT
jgi:hypothetical protein